MKEQSIFTHQKKYHVTFLSLWNFLRHWNQGSQNPVDIPLQNPGTFSFECMQRDDSYRFYGKLSRTFQNFLPNNKPLCWRCFFFPKLLTTAPSYVPHVVLEDSDALRMVHQFDIPDNLTASAAITAVEIKSSNAQIPCTPTTYKNNR